MGLKREDILAGVVEEKVKEAERLGLTTLLPPEERQASKRAVLQALAGDEIWLFGYGSLMWNPCIHHVDRQSGLLRGYHRNFCLRTPTGRGSPAAPGLMLALKPGGSCRGIAYRIDAEVAEHELDVVWNREMVSGAYVAKVVNLEMESGIQRAATFVINRNHPRYVAQIALQEAAAMIATAEGWLGTCADYLFNTVEHMDELGMADGTMHELMRLVQERQRAVKLLP